MQTRHSRRILYVAYPLLPVSEASCGGAEQILATVEREMWRKGWNTTTAACSGSSACGAVFATGAPGGASLQSAQGHEEKHARKILELMAVREAIGRGFEVVHDHSGSFFTNASQVDGPVLATLHLPRSFYPNHFFTNLSQNLFFNGVSASQARNFADVPQMLGPVANGISLERFPLQIRKHEYLLWLGRICEEKGAHIALDVAEKTGLPIVIAGKVYPLAYHQQYFEREIVPQLGRMGGRARFVESPSFKKKLALLQGARAVLIPSLAEEANSLVAMEAAACGTPVVAFRKGALPEVIRHDETGFVVDCAEQMGQVLGNVRKIKPRSCHDYAQHHFSSKRMADEYERLYERVLSKEPLLQAA